MMRTMRLGFGILAMVLAAVGPAAAHHSFAGFDMKKELVLKGTVLEFQWANPHVWIEIEVPDDRGGSKQWSIEGGAPAGLSRQGWKRTTLKRGDRIRIAIHPLRDGRSGGSLIGLELPDGRTLGPAVDRPAASAAR